MKKVLSVFVEESGETGFENGALTDEIDNRDIFIKGIDCSYCYEEED